MSRRALIVLLAAFLVSVAVRVPQLNRPLSAHHEYCTAFTLIALTNWWEDGFVHHHGVPSGGFVEEGRALLVADASDRNEQATNLYYFSHPPLAYDLPYAVFKVVGVPPNVLGLQLINLFFHLITVLALFFVVNGITPFDERAALFASVLYLFMPAPLWFHSNVFMSDMFVQVLWVVHLVFAMDLFRRSGVLPAGRMILFGATLFLVVYTSWLGVFAALTAVLLALWYRWKNGPGQWLLVAGVASAAVLIALGLTAWRYLQVIDAQALLAHFGQRFQVRGTFSLPDGPWPHLRQLIVNYRMGYLPVILLLVIVAVIRRNNGTSKGSDTVAMPVFLCLTGLPVLLDHAFLLQYADHDFAALKTGPVLCGSAGLAVAGLSRTRANMAVVLTCLAGVLYFYRINPMPGHDRGRYALERSLGEAIAKEAAPDEIVFVVGLSAEPQVTWYARRNVHRVPSVDYAKDFLQEHRPMRGVLFQEEKGVLQAEHFSAP